MLLDRTKKFEDKSIDSEKWSKNRKGFAMSRLSAIMDVVVIALPVQVIRHTADGFADEGQARKKCPLIDSRSS